MSAPPPALRVLVVDDNADAADSLSLLLALWGHQARSARDGAAALAAAAEFRPDVALLDLGLPGMDGYEVARRLRELPGLEGVVLIAVTGYTDEEHRRRCEASGFVFYLLKPTEPEVLETILHALAGGGGPRHWAGAQTTP